MKIWICIPVFNRLAFTLACLESLKTQTYTNFTLVICDHGSTDGTRQAIQQQYPQVVLLTADSNLWWTGAINRCVNHVLQHAAADDLLLTMNNDNVVFADYLQNLLNHFLTLPDAIITSVIYNINTGELVSRGYRQNWLLATSREVDFNSQHLPGLPDVVEVTHASGRGTLFPLKVFREQGLFSEQRMPHYAADYDFAFRAARAGYRIYSCLDCKVYSHIEETGLEKVLDRFSVKSFVDYLTSMRSPANLKVRWWYGWQNCPRSYLPIYFFMDIVRILGGYFKKFVFKSAG